MPSQNRADDLNIYVVPERVPDPQVALYEAADADAADPRPQGSAAFT